MAGTRRGHRTILDRNECEVGVEFRHVASGVDWSDFDVVEIVEEAVVSFALTTENVNVVVDDAAGVAVTALRDRAGLRALDPAEELGLVGIVAVGQSLRTVIS